MSAFIRSRSDNPGSSSATTARSVPVKVTSSHSSASAWDRASRWASWKTTRLKPVGSVPHREGRQDTLPDELQFVAQRAAQQRRRRLVLERRRARASTASRARGRSHDHRVSARSSSPSSCSLGLVPAPRARCITASPTSRSGCSTCRRSTAIADGPPISRPTRTSSSCARRPCSSPPKPSSTTTSAASPHAHQRVHRRAGGPPVVEMVARSRRAAPRPPANRHARERGVRRHRGRDRRAARAARFDPSQLPGSHSPSMSAASMRSRASSEPASRAMLGRDLQPGPHRRPCDVSATATATLTSDADVARVRRDRRRDPTVARPRRARGCSPPARAATDRRGRRVRPPRPSPGPLHEPFERIGADVHAFVDDQPLESHAAARDARAVVRMSSPSRTSRSSSLSTRRSIAMRLLSLLDGQIGRVERAAAEVREQVRSGTRGTGAPPRRPTPSRRRR